MHIEQFRKTRFFDPSDPLLAKHPDNPAMKSSDGKSPFFSDKPPLMQYLYKFGEGNFVLIAKQLEEQGEVYGMWWGQGGDEVYKTLEEAECAVFDFIMDERSCTFSDKLDNGSLTISQDSTGTHFNITCDDGEAFVVVDDATTHLIIEYLKTLDT